MAKAYRQFGSKKKTKKCGFKFFSHRYNRVGKYSVFVDGVLVAEVQLATVNRSKRARWKVKGNVRIVPK